jgi:hypothetical protein
MSQDIENLKNSMQLHSDFVEDLPFVGSGCAYAYGIGFIFPFGGYGTFFNKVAIHQLTQPMYCVDGETFRQQSNRVENSDFMTLSCNSLQQNIIGELDVFRNGNSALDLFYKYSATRQFCLHSDWALGYMVSHYLHQDISYLKPQRCRRHKCDLESITCHNHGPEDMEKFVREHSSAQHLVARL